MPTNNAVNTLQAPEKSLMCIAEEARTENTTARPCSIKASGGQQVAATLTAELDPKLPKLIQFAEYEMPSVAAHNNTHTIIS